MAISVNPITGVIFVPRADMTLIQDTPTEIRQHDMSAFRLVLRDWEDSVDGRPWQRTHDHNTTVTISGLDLARVLLILAPYTVTYEDGQYAVNIVGANTNVGDRVNVNQVSVRTSNSAGMTSSQDLEYASYNGRVTIDKLSSYVGTNHPIGTERQPVNNVPDALLIDQVRGFGKLGIKGDLTLGNGDDYTGLTIVGQNTIKTALTIEAEAIVNAVIITDCRVSGVLDGDVIVRECVVDNLQYVTGYLSQCAMVGPIYVANLSIVVMLQCRSVTKTPVPIDMGGDGQTLQMSSCTGDWLISNMSGDSFAEMDVSGGSIILDTLTVTGGTVTLRGTATLYDTEGNNLVSGIWNGVTILNDASNPWAISHAVWIADMTQYTAALTAGKSQQIACYIPHAIYIDTEATVNGNGSQCSPFNNLKDTLDFAELNNTRDIVSISPIVLDRNIQSYNFIGTGLSQLDFNGRNANRCSFYGLTLIGEYNGFIRANECNLMDGFYLDGGFLRCGIMGDLICVNSAMVTIVSCFTHIEDGIPANISMGETNNSTLAIKGHDGNLTISDCDTSTCFADITMARGRLELLPSCTLGNIKTYGVCDFDDNSNGSVVVDSTHSGKTVAEDVWSHLSGQLILKTLNNNKSLVKNGSVWELTIYDDDNITPLVVKPLKDKDGLDITDLVAGDLAIELKNIV